MEADLIIVSEYCRKTNIDPVFFHQLEEGGLITIFIEDGEKYFPSSQLPDLEKYARLYYDLSINIEGIDVIRNLQDRIRELYQEINHLKHKLTVYDRGFFDELE